MGISSNFFQTRVAAARQRRAGRLGQGFAERLIDPANFPADANFPAAAAAVGGGPAPWGNMPQNGKDNVLIALANIYFFCMLVCNSIADFSVKQKAANSLNGPNFLRNFAYFSIL